MSLATARRTATHWRRCSTALPAHPANAAYTTRFIDRLTTISIKRLDAMSSDFIFATSSAHSMKETAHAFLAIFRMHRVTFTLSSRSLRALDRHWLNVRNCSRARNALANREARPTFAANAALSQTRCCHSKKLVDSWLWEIRAIARCTIAR